MIPMLASQLRAETDWRVTECEVLMDQSITDTDEAFGLITITSKNGINIFFNYTSYLDKPVEMDELSIFNADNIEVCIDENDDDEDVLSAAYEIVGQTDWERVAMNAKYQNNS